MENEENKGLIKKKVYEYQLESFCSDFHQFYGGDLFYSFSLSHIVGRLEYYWSTLGECGILGRAGKRRRTSGSAIKIGLLCRYRVACMVSLLVLECMVRACGFLVMSCHWHEELPRLTMVFPSLSISWIAMVLGV